MKEDRFLSNEQISQYIRAARELKRGNYQIELQTAPMDDLGRLGQALNELARTLEQRYRQVQQLGMITAHINAGLMLEEILESVYRDFKAIIPYNRIGFSLLEEDGAVVKAFWARTDQPEVHLPIGYKADLAGSSLEDIIKTGEPRILNDLLAYLEGKPSSDSTRRIVSEGIRSSLTCPLIAGGVPIGFMFFSSVEPNTYTKTHISTFKNIAGQLSVIVEKGRLVSELATEKASVEAKNVELQRLNDMKNAFLGMAAHDLRNPIAYVQMVSEFMTDPYYALTPEQQAQFLVDVRKQANHMLKLLDELLDVTKIESGKLELKPEPLILHDFLDENIRRHQQFAATKQTQVILEAGAEGAIEADPVRLRQVIDNLISNAVKFSPPKSTIRIRVEREDRHWRISVIDQGPGLTQQDQERLFQDFARLSAKPTAGESSTGLGLAITRRIVEAHGGKIGAFSEPGQGATFWFTLLA